MLIRLLLVWYTIGKDPDARFGRRLMGIPVSETLADRVGDLRIHFRTRVFRVS